MPRYPQPAGTGSTIWAWLQRTRWGARHLQSTSAGAVGCSEQGQPSPVTRYRMAGTVHAGAYMVEVMIDCEVMQIGTTFEIEGIRKRDQTVSMPLPLVASRIGKRLLLLDRDAVVYWSVPLPAKSFATIHFRMVRVTENFFRSRMKAKLVGLHPLYKIENTSDTTKWSSVVRAKQWGDYCNLFGDRRNLFSYEEWITHFDGWSDEAADTLPVPLLKPQSLVSIVFLIGAGTIDCGPAIATLRAQSYQNWKLVFVSRTRFAPQTLTTLQLYAASDPRIHLTCQSEEEIQSNWLGDAIDCSDGSWFLFLGQNELLARGALQRMVGASEFRNDIGLVYSDSDTIDAAGIRHAPRFAPDWNIDLFYSQSMFLQFAMYSAALVRKARASESGVFDQSDAYLYSLQLDYVTSLAGQQILHVPAILHHARAPAAGSTIGKVPCATRCDAMQRHFDRTGVDAEVSLLEHGYRVEYAVPTPAPLVSLIIPTRNGLFLLEKCIKSILDKTRYPAYEIIIIDNGSDDPATLNYLSQVSRDARIAVRRDDRPFNYSALNNTAIRACRGTIVGLLNNDVEVINPEWLSEMVSHACRPGVGAVGARLWYADESVQHAGVILGLEGFAGHVNRYLPKGDPGYECRAALTQSFSAVTGACMVVQKSTYLAVGGLNEVDLIVGCNDIDLCLKIRAAGFRNVWTPHANLFHHESATRGHDDTPEKVARAARESAYMWDHWGNILRDDPAYNPNLSLDSSDFSLAWPPRQRVVTTAADCSTNP